LKVKSAVEKTKVRQQGVNGAKCTPGMLEADGNVGETINLGARDLGRELQWSVIGGYKTSGVTA
jgi:hypothetical protein